MQYIIFTSIWENACFRGAFYSLYIWFLCVSRKKYAVKAILNLKQGKYIFIYISKYFWEIKSKSITSRLNCTLQAACSGLFCPRSTLVVLFISICTWFAVEERVQNETWIMWRRGGGGGVATKTYRLTLNLRNPSSLSHERPFLWTFVFMWQLVAQFYEGRHSKRGENETWQMAD